MRKQITEEIPIPLGVECDYKDQIFICKKGAIELKRKIKLPRISLFLKDNKVILNSLKANKKDKKTISSHLHHLKNMFDGLDNKYIYKLESCNVHFPMTLKVESNKLVINNFLGEKIPRYAKILENVEVQIKGTSITISSHNKEAAGQTAANFEKATKVSNRDRRIFQDGIYIVEKAGEKI